MTAGDVVTVLSAENTILTFQPAAGVEVMITSFFTEGVDAQPAYTDGTATVALSSGLAALNVAVSNLNMRVFCTNDFFITVAALGAGQVSGFTGIQSV